MGHEERFLPPRLSAGCGFRKETIAGMRRNGRDAPIPDLPALILRTGCFHPIPGLDGDEQILGNALQTQTSGRSAE
jgi:hypothetical protein